MSRYSVCSGWTKEETYEVHVYDEDKDATFAHVYATEFADIKDSKNGDTFRNGAYRVTKNGKPIKTGKGGTVPFYGEMAWADAARLFNDEVFAARRNAY